MKTLSKIKMYHTTKHGLKSFDNVATTVANTVKDFSWYNSIETKQTLTKKLKHFILNTYWSIYVIDFFNFFLWKHWLIVLHVLSLCTLCTLFLIRYLFLREIGRRIYSLFLLFGVTFLFSYSHSYHPCIGSESEKKTFCSVLFFPIKCRQFQNKKISSFFNRMNRNLKSQ